MGRPGLTINLMNGGLNLKAPSVFGTSAVIISSPVAPVAGFGVPFVVNTILQATAALGQVGNEEALQAITDYYFAEAPEGTKLYVMCLAQATLLATAATAVNADKVLNAGNGDIRLLSFIKFPAEDYEPVITNGFDVDVHNAVVAAQTLCNAWLAKDKPFRAFVDGFGFVDTNTAKDYVAASDRNISIVTANIDGFTQFATMLVMGREAGIEPQQNAGRILDGSLNISETAVVKIGAIKVDDMSSVDLDTLFNKRYITIEKNEVDSGYVITYDSTLTAPTDDYNNLRYGRISDNITRIIKATYYTQVKNDVNVDSGGRLSVIVEKALSDSIVQNIDNEIRSQLSLNPNGSAAVIALVNPAADKYAALYAANGISNPNFNILQTGGVYIFVQYRPKGSLDYISVYQGFTTA
ncbi:hypothetical protein SAMN05428988_1314 [Chitinophaga sp. YR573]|uniref:DUF2586 family protein n=1 Tax=Chitinophaga sp. YR573 TaxID=1881040 RepID=UPI0008D5882C|nr:DUF2586 family protein [Chitinophaga sp. YR573]SEW01937.1 hypothetical protein SAMN05428988_1314 [Chitinophaga sp. YR573]